MKNPFKILGLDVFELGGLSIKQLKMIINSQYRALQKCHHPDIGGSEKKSRLLNWAREELLTSDEKLMEWIERLSSRRTVINEMEKNVTSYAKIVAFYRNNLFSLYSILTRNGINGNYANLLGLSEAGIKICRSLTMNQQDTLLAGIGSEIKDKEERRLFRQAERQKMINRTFFTLVISDGLLIEINCNGEQKNISHKLLIGVITPETIRKKFNGSQEPIRSFLAKVCPKPKSHTGLTYEGNVSSNNSIDLLTKAQLIRLLPFLSNEVKEEGWLISLSLDQEGNITGQLEGQIFNRVHQAKIV